MDRSPAPDQLFRVRPDPHDGGESKLTCLNSALPPGQEPPGQEPPGRNIDVSDVTKVSDASGVFRGTKVTRLPTDRYLRTGSNNWAVSGARTATGSALLCGDTHLDPRMLPGVWYPVGLISRDIRAVGVNIPGIPGMAMGRTSHIALAMTNNYADLQDLYLVRVDPEHPGRYLDKGRSRPFDVRKEILKIKDPRAPSGFRHHEITVQSTDIGPVVTGRLDGLTLDTPVALRFAPAESMIPDIGLLRILTAKNCGALKQALTTLPMISMNWVFADIFGRIGYQTSGRVPIRKKGYGTFLRSDTGIFLQQEDPWVGWIPVDEMPGILDPPAGWIGTCNHKTVPSDYPYYYSSYFAPRYRYERLAELMTELTAQPPAQQITEKKDPDKASTEFRTDGSFKG